MDGVSFDVRPHELVGLIGPNGAGKTTCIDAVTGLTHLTAGQVVLEGRDITRATTHGRARLRLGRTFQSLELFEDLTVRQNVLVAVEQTRWWSVFGDLVRPNRRRDLAQVDWALGLLELEDVADRRPSELSQGRRKHVSVARALAMRPSVLLLDEPAAGLDTAESEELGKRLRAVVDSGISLLLVDHDMSLVLSVCDRVYVLEFGKLIAHGSPAEVRSDAAVVAAYLGSGELDGAPR
ncbi:MAG TPA: ABC transporter ATP-binding protein [Acidimicrobiales bacterium]|nr:ABC transporter ATP-binding protein [Acidimicrobiales bacterium]